MTHPRPSVRGTPTRGRVQPVALATTVIRILAAPLLLALLLTLPACGPKRQTDLADTPQPTLDASVLRQRHNDRANRIQRFWARAVAEIHWLDEKGKRQFEQGDGPLIVRKPDELALALGKLGETYYWLGSNAQRFWLLDLHSQPRKAFVGRHADLAGAAARPLPIAVRPDSLIELLGVVPLPDPPAQPGALAPEPDVEDAKVGYWFRTPLTATADGHAAELQVFIPEPAGHPSIVRFVDTQGLTLAESRLTDYQQLQIKGKSMADWPEMPTRIEITAPARQARLTLFLSDMIDDPQKILDAQFDFDRLVRALKIQTIEPLQPRTTTP